MNLQQFSEHTGIPLNKDTRQTLLLLHQSGINPQRVESIDFNKLLNNRNGDF